jgi:hypothetical protein
MKGASGSGRARTAISTRGHLALRDNRRGGSLRDNVFKPGEFSAILGFGAGIGPRRIPDHLMCCTAPSRDPRLKHDVV